MTTGVAIPEPVMVADRKASEAELSDVSNPINTANKKAGAMVFNTTTGETFIACGSRDHDKWATHQWPGRTYVVTPV